MKAGSWNSESILAGGDWQILVSIWAEVDQRGSSLMLAQLRTWN